MWSFFWLRMAALCQGLGCVLVLFIYLFPFLLHLVFIPWGSIWMHLAIGSTKKEESQMTSSLGLWLWKFKAQQRHLFSACSRVSGLCNVFPVSLSLLISCIFEQGNEELCCLFKQVGTTAVIKATRPAPAGSDPWFFVNCSSWGWIYSGVRWLQANPSRCSDKEWKAEVLLSLTACRQRFDNIIWIRL